MINLSIRTPRLLIRNLKLSDLHDFHTYRSDSEVTKYQSFDVMTLDEAEDFINEHTNKIFGNPGEWIQYGIENILTGKIIGDCAIKLNEHDSRMAEIGITISPLEQQKGYAKEVMTSILDFLFAIEDFHRVVEIVDEENIASINLLKSLGFRQEGHFIQNIFFKGKWGNEFQFAIVKEEWKAGKASIGN